MSTALERVENTLSAHYGGVEWGHGLGTDLQEVCAQLRAAEAVARCAADYLRCLAEFTDTAAGNLSDCCAEHLQHLDATVDRWKETPDG